MSVRLIQGGPIEGKSAQGGESRARQSQMLALSLDEFAWEAITEQARERGVSIESLVRFSVLYYLADLDSERIARCLPDALAL